MAPKSMNASSPERPSDFRSETKFLGGKEIREVPKRAYSVVGAHMAEAAAAERPPPPEGAETPPAPSEPAVPATGGVDGAPPATEPSPAAAGPSPEAASASDKASEAEKLIAQEDAKAQSTGLNGAPLPAGWDDLSIEERILQFHPPVEVTTALIGHTHEDVDGYYAMMREHRRASYYLGLADRAASSNTSIPQFEQPRVEIVD